MAVGSFFLCSPDCAKQPRTSFPFYKFFYPIVSAKVSGTYLGCGAVDWMQLVLHLVQCLHLVLMFLKSMPCMIHLLFLHTNRTGNHNQHNPNHVHHGRLPYTQCRDHPCHRCCIYKNADNGVHNLFLCRCTIGH